MNIVTDGPPSDKWRGFAKQKLAQIKDARIESKNFLLNGYLIRLSQNNGFDKAFISEPIRLLKSMGGNTDGALGLGDNLGVIKPTPVPANPTWVMVAAGGGHSAGIRTDGTLWTWGFNDAGQLGLGDKINRNAPERVKEKGPWVQVSCGLWHTMAIKHDGTLWAWGFNCYGQLGLADESFAGQGTFSGCKGTVYPERYISRTVPTQVGARTWKCVSAGGNSTYAIRTDDTLWYAGYLLTHDTGSVPNVAAFTQLGASADWSTVSAGYQHAMMLKTDGSLWANGDPNATGAAARPVYTHGTYLVNSGVWSSIAGGVDCTLAIDDGGALWATGLNAYGQLGTGGGDIKALALVDSGPWRMVSSNGRQSVAIKDDGSLWSWGYGTPRDTTTATPGRVDDSVAWVSVATGFYNFFLAVYGWKGMPDFAPLNRIPGMHKCLS